ARVCRHAVSILQNAENKRLGRHIRSQALSVSRPYWLRPASVCENAPHLHSSLFYLRFLHYLVIMILQCNFERFCMSNAV
ncbi:hypothetical protein, partial [Ruthenibacterium lactatiformans]|uniref:hypothetical protein n=1 Tax=Ruthenibacterium lactatiformans TaxID=1550024 RepID=UPI003AF10E85